MRNYKIIRLDTKEVQKRFFELLDKIRDKELIRVEIEIDGEIVGQIIPISNSNL